MELPSAVVVLGRASAVVEMVVDVVEGPAKEADLTGFWLFCVLEVGALCCELNLGRCFGGCSRVGCDGDLADGERPTFWALVREGDGFDVGGRLVLVGLARRDTGDPSSSLVKERLIGALRALRFGFVRGIMLIPSADVTDCDW